MSDCLWVQCFPDGTISATVTGDDQLPPDYDGQQYEFPIDTQTDGMMIIDGNLVPCPS